MVKIQEIVTQRDIPEKAITIQCLNTDKITQGAWEHKEGTDKKIQKDVPVKAMSQPAPK